MSKLIKPCISMVKNNLKSEMNEMCGKEEDARKELEEMTNNVPTHGRIVEEYTVSIFEDDTFEDFQKRLDTVSDVAWKLHFKKLNK